MKELRSAVWKWTGHWGLRGLAIMAGLGLLLFGLVTFSQATRDSLRRQDRYQIAFAEIACQPPPGSERSDFLAEVQYLSNMPARLWLLDEDLPARLADAFAHHRWVEHVEQVAIVAPRRIEVRLVYRTPVLAVCIPRPGGGYEVQVDASGIRLGSISTPDLPRYTPRLQPADGDSRTWDEAGVVAAARTAGFLRPYQDRLHLQVIDGTADQLILKGAWPGLVLWGPAPGTELSTQARAAEKLKRLLRCCGEAGSSHGEDAAPFDLRALGKK